MLEKRQDIWTCQADAICVTTNGITKKDGRAVMGAGIALRARERYPQIDLLLGERLTKEGNSVKLLHRGGSQPWPSEDRAIVSFPTKQHWRDKSSLELIILSSKQLVELSDTEGWQKVLLPRPGCGMGGLDWAQVKKEIEPFFDDRFSVLSF
jgi:hypothetical protein